VSPADPTGPAAEGVAAAVQEVSERASVLVREEIELAKAEMQFKARSLTRGAVIAAAAGVFVVIAVLFILTAAAWGIWVAFFGDSQDYWLGFLIVAVLLLLAAGIAGWLAAKAFKRGSPPTPQMAIDEARLIQDTVTAPFEQAPAASAVTDGGTAPAPADERAAVASAAADATTATGAGTTTGPQPPSPEETP